MRTRNLEKAIEAVTRVYCPHTVELIGHRREVDVVLEVRRPTFQPVVELAYNAPVRIDAGDFSHLFLMMHCTRGSAATTQQGRAAEWRMGQTMPFSAGMETQLWFDPHFVQHAVRLDVDKLEEQCRQWLGRPLDSPLRFALQPFSSDLEETWQRTLAYLQSRRGTLLSLSSAAKAAFDEYLLTMLLHQHPHNFSEEIAETVSTPVPGLVIRAERYMADNSDSPITVSDVADHLGISLRSLQAAFHGWRNSTASAFLRSVRLQRVHDELVRSDGDANVTSIALRHGFSHLGRFSAYYRSAFGEDPSVTLRRSRASRRTRRSEESQR